MSAGVPDLHLRQGIVTDVITESNKVIGVELQDTRRIGAKAVVIATGTFLNGTIHTGRRTFSAGRAGEPASIIAISSRTPESPWRAALWRRATIFM